MEDERQEGLNTKVWLEPTENSSRLYTWRAALWGRDIPCLSLTSRRLSPGETGAVSSKSIQRLTTDPRKGKWSLLCGSSRTPNVLEPAEQFCPAPGSTPGVWRRTMRNQGFFQVPPRPTAPPHTPHCLIQVSPEVEAGGPYFHTLGCNGLAIGRWRLEAQNRREIL